jgi:hypothetical protein
LNKAAARAAHQRCSPLPTVAAALNTLLASPSWPAFAEISGLGRTTRNSLENCRVDQILVPRDRTLVANQIRCANEWALQVATDTRRI